MKVSAEFLKAKNSKEVTAIVFQKKDENISSDNKTVLRLCLDEKSKFTGESTMVFIETNIDIHIDNYGLNKTGLIKENVKRVTCHLPVYKHTQNLGRTILNKIKKDSELCFRVVAYNSTEFLSKLNLIRHDFYLDIDNDTYLLETYVGTEFTNPITF